MNELSEDFIRDYCLYLRNKVGLAQSSVWIYSIPLKHIVTTAHYNGKMARNPFAQYKVDPDHKERGFLTEDELQAFTTIELNNPDLELARDHEWVKMFHSNIDRLLVSIEKLFESRQPGAFNDELLTDKEVCTHLESEPKDFTGLPQQWHLVLHSGRWQNSLPNLRCAADNNERIQGGV